jgi:acyl-CoA synthetase (AMP-forming)/AMP-acid ligase II
VWVFLAPRPGARLDEGEVLAWCATRLADFKRPARITVMAALPKGPTGKLLKAPLRALAGTRP